MRLLRWPDSLGLPTIKGGLLVEDKRTDVHVSEYLLYGQVYPDFLYHKVIVATRQLEQHSGS